MFYKVLSCSPNILSGLIRRLTHRKCGLIAIKQKKRYLLPDLSNVGECNRLKESWKGKKSKWINTQTTINSKDTVLIYKARRLQLNNLNFSLTSKRRNNLLLLSGLWFTNYCRVLPTY